MNPINKDYTKSLTKEFSVYKSKYGTNRIEFLCTTKGFYAWFYTDDELLNNIEGYSEYKSSQKDIHRNVRSYDELVKIEKRDHERHSYYLIPDSLIQPFLSKVKRIFKKGKKEVIKYNKLIRDKIPEIIANSGKSFKVEKMNNKEYLIKLKEKLIEEAKEVNKANKKEIVGELADVLEIVEALEKAYSINHKTVIKKKNIKAKSNGKFNKKLLLKEVIENDK